MLHPSVQVVPDISSPYGPLAEQSEAVTGSGAADAVIAVAAWALVIGVAAFSVSQMIGAFQQAKATIDRRDEREKEEQRQAEFAAEEKKRKIKQMFERL